MSNLYDRNKLQQNLMFPNNNYYQQNYYNENDHFNNLPYSNYYEQTNIYNNPRKLFIRKNPQYVNEAMNATFSESRSNKRNPSRIAYPSPFANVQYRQDMLSYGSHHSENTRRIPDIQSNRMFQQRYSNSNDSSNGNKSFYDILKDSPSIKKKNNNMNISTESQKELFKALREENTYLVKSFMDGLSQNLNGFMNGLTQSLKGMTQGLTKGMNEFLRKQEENNKKFLMELSEKLEK